MTVEKKGVIPLITGICLCALWLPLSEAVDTAVETSGDLPEVHFFCFLEVNENTLKKYKKQGYRQERANI